jgi:nitroimidazol reductase NimA-like FMN-containing flavoprotein (pyridoxamine 5'-phosphate oxidase superfamily)
MEPRPTLSLDPVGPGASLLRGGPWCASQVFAHLAGATLPLRLATASGRGGPLVASLWFLFDEGALWCATQAKARLAEVLWEEPRCAFEVAGDAPPYRGVRGQGRAELLPERGGEILARLIDRYLGRRDGPLAGWLLGRAGAEVAIRIEPRRLSSFDYTARMASEGAHP